MTARKTSVRNLFATVLIGLVAAIVMSPTVSAHLPEFDLGGQSFDEAREIDDISTSYAFYGDLPFIERGNPEGARYFVFDGQQGQRFEFMVGIKPAYIVSPGVLLVGPGLPDPNGTAESIIAATGIQIPEGLGAVGWQWYWNGSVPQWISVLVEEDLEPFTQTPFWYANAGNISLPTSGTYYIVFTGLVVTDLDAPHSVDSVRCFLVTGSEEKYGLADFALISWYWFRVQDFWGGPDDIHFLTPTLVVVSIGLALDFGSRRKKGPKSHWPMSGAASHYSGLVGALLMIGIGSNQIALLALYSSLHHWQGLAFLVLAMQSACVIIGLFALRTVSSCAERPEISTIARVGAITVAALLFGAGMIIGPTLFVLGAVIAWSSWFLAKRKRRPGK